MTHRSPQFLTPDECRDEVALRAFIQSSISPNAWPIHSPRLRQQLHQDGLQIGGMSESFGLDDLGDMLAYMGKRSSRLERCLHIENAFHRTPHNFEVLLRLLVLEWPEEAAIPDFVQAAAVRRYTSLADICTALLEVLAAMLAAGVASATLARDVLAALSHDYGHTGGTERRDAYGRAAQLTHEEMAERHAAAVGLRYGMSPAVVIESMAAVRATTFHTQHGRERVTPATPLEHKLALADVMGCALPMPLWLGHVAIPVLLEKLPQWSLRMAHIPQEIAVLDAALSTLADSHPEREMLRRQQERLRFEHARIIKNFEEWLRSERGFLLHIEAHQLRGNARAWNLWSDELFSKVSRIDRVLARPDLLTPLNVLGTEVLASLTAVSIAADEQTLVLPENAPEQLQAVFALLTSPDPA